MKNKKTKSDNGRGMVNVVQVETMEKLGFDFVKVEGVGEQGCAFWTFNSGGPMAVHGLELCYNIDAQIDFKTAVNHIWHEAWGTGRDSIKDNLKRLLSN